MVILHQRKGRKEGQVLFNDNFNTFYIQLYWRQRKGRKEGKVLFNDTQHILFMVILHQRKGRKEGKVLFNDTLNTFSFIRRFVKNKPDINRPLSF